LYGLGFKPDEQKKPTRLENRRILGYKFLNFLENFLVVGACV
jgi:hypothetical protein